MSVTRLQAWAKLPPSQPSRRPASAEQAVAPPPVPEAADAPESVAPKKPKKRKGA